MNNAIKPKRRGTTVFYCKLESKNFDFDGLEGIVTASIGDSIETGDLRIFTNVSQSKDGSGTNIYLGKVGIDLLSSVNIDFVDVKYLLGAISSIFELISGMTDVQITRIFIGLRLQKCLLKQQV